jgi:hypothetical protein
MRSGSCVDMAALGREMSACKMDKSWSLDVEMDAGVVRAGSRTIAPSRGLQVVTHQSSRNCERRRLV